MNWSLGNNPYDEQKFLDQVNEVGVPKGLLHLDTKMIKNFLATYVLADWLNQPIAVSAHKTNLVENGETIATLGSLCCIKYPGYKLSKYPLAASIWHALSTGADYLQARCTPASQKIFEQFGFIGVEEHIDGKTLMRLSVTADLTVDKPHKLSIELPSFTDGGVYD